MKPGTLELKGQESAHLFQVLSSKTRRDILAVLRRGPARVSAIARELGVSRPSVTRHVQDLEAAGLVTASYISDANGQQKVCRLKYESVSVSFERNRHSAPRIVEVDMPVGLYTRIEAAPPCGLAGSTGIIGAIDHPQSFYLPERVEAELLWNGHGFVEYSFPNQAPAGARLLRLELAMEIGSEIALHRIDVPSDITVWVNEAELGTWTSLGGLTSRRGQLTPDWWWDTRTQHGMLKVWAVDAGGAYVDGSLVSGLTIDDVPLEPGGSIIVRIGFRPDAVNIGGFNLYGCRFGNYEQGILMRLHYLPEDAASGDAGARLREASAK